MTDTKERKPGPIEVWLSKANIEVTCRVVREDESTTEMNVEALSMRGAQREVTGYFIMAGYTPAGRWSEEYEDRGDTVEAMRQFKPGDGAEAI